MEKYTKVRLLGKGSFGSAILIKRRSDNAFFVIKEVFLGKMSRKEREEARHECRVLQQLNHPNIVRYVEHFENRNNLYIVMEYCDGGDLHEKLKAGAMKESVILYYFSQICLAMEYLHARHILHRDIKTMNVFLMKNGSVKLGDFGISTVLRNTMGMANTVCGTPYYFSPEICRNKPYNDRSDVWALGVLLYEMATGRHPFDANSMQQLMQRIVKGNYKPLSSSFSLEFRKMVDWCLQKDPSKRPSIRQTLALTIVRRSLEQLEENLMLATQCKVRLRDIMDFDLGQDESHVDNNKTNGEQKQLAGRPHGCVSPSGGPAQQSPREAAAAQQNNGRQQSPHLHLSPGAEAAVGLLGQQRPAQNFALLGPKPGVAAAAVDHNRIDNYRRHLMEQYQRKVNAEKNAKPAPGANGCGAPQTPVPLPASPVHLPGKHHQKERQEEQKQDPQQQEQQQQQQRLQRNVTPPPAAAVDPRHHNQDDALREKLDGFDARMRRMNAIMERYAQNVDSEARDTIHAYMKRKQDEYMLRQKQQQERLQRRAEIRKRELAKVIEHQNILAKGDVAYRQQQRAANQNPLSLQNPVSPRSGSPPSPQKQKQNAVFGRDPRAVHRPAKEVEQPIQLQVADPVQNNNNRIGNKQRRAEHVERKKKKVLAANSPRLLAPPKVRQQQQPHDPSARKEVAQTPQAVSAAAAAVTAAAARAARINNDDRNGNINGKFNAPQPFVAGRAGAGVDAVGHGKGWRAVDNVVSGPEPSAAKKSPPPPKQQQQEKRKDLGMLRIVSAPILDTRMVIGSNPPGDDAGDENENIDSEKKAVVPNRHQPNGNVRRSSAPLHSLTEEKRAHPGSPCTSLPNVGKKQIIRPTAAAGFMPHGVSNAQQHLQHQQRKALGRDFSSPSGLAIFSKQPFLNFISKEELPAGVDQRHKLEQQCRQHAQNAERKLPQEKQAGKADRASFCQTPKTGIEPHNRNGKRGNSIGQLVDDKQRKEEQPPAALAPLQVRQRQPVLPRSNSPSFASSPSKVSGAAHTPFGRPVAGKQPLPLNNAPPSQPGIAQNPGVVGFKVPPQSRVPMPVPTRARSKSISVQKSVPEERPILLDVDYGVSPMVAVNTNNAKQAPAVELGSAPVLSSIDGGLEPPDVLQQWRNVAKNNGCHRMPLRTSFIHDVSSFPSHETQPFSEEDDVLAAFQKAKGSVSGVPSILEVLRPLRDNVTEDAAAVPEQRPNVSIALLKQKLQESNLQLSLPDSLIMGLPLPIGAELSNENQLDGAHPPRSQRSSVDNTEENVSFSLPEISHRDTAQKEEHSALVALVDGIKARGSEDSDHVEISITSTDLTGEPSLDSYLAMLDHLRGLLHRSPRPSKAGDYDKRKKESNKNQESQKGDDDATKKPLTEAHVAVLEGKEEPRSPPLNASEVTVSITDDLPTPKLLIVTKQGEEIQKNSFKQGLYLLDHAVSEDPTEYNNNNNNNRSDEEDYNNTAEEEITADGDDDDEENGDDSGFEDALPLSPVRCATVSGTYRLILERARYLPAVLAAKEREDHHEDENQLNAVARSEKIGHIEHNGVADIIENISSSSPDFLEEECSIGGDYAMHILHSSSEYPGVVPESDDNEMRE